jgi:hypothetical protein
VQYVCSKYLYIYSIQPHMDTYTHGYIHTYTHIHTRDIAILKKSSICVCSVYVYLYIHTHIHTWIHTREIITILEQRSIRVSMVYVDLFIHTYMDTYKRRPGGYRTKLICVCSSVYTYTSYIHAYIHGYIPTTSSMV